MSLSHPFIFGLHSNMFCAYSRNPHDDNHDPAHQEQVHRSRCVASINGFDTASTHLEAFTGRKEIVMFFYMYAFIELLAFFLDSGVIPSAHVSYPVRGLVISSRKHMMLNVSHPSLVVCRNLYRAGGGDVHMSADQWFCRVLVCRGWNTVIIMGMQLS